jgi:hypothetical protein
VAQNTPLPPTYQRVPMMDASLLDDRTRPPQQDSSPIWLRHRLQRRSTSATSRARAWFRQRVSRSPSS